jgi:hypothetical protein
VSSYLPIFLSGGATRFTTRSFGCACGDEAKGDKFHDDLKVLFIKDAIQEKSINHHDKPGNHSNPILQPLLEQQQRRRLKKLVPADLIDGCRGFTH